MTAFFSEHATVIYLVCALVVCVTYLARRRARAKAPVV